jgi:hypothetical protein
MYDELTRPPVNVIKFEPGDFTATQAHTHHQ